MTRVIRLAVAAGAVAAASFGTSASADHCPVPDDSKFAGLHRLVCDTVTTCYVPDDSKFAGLHKLVCEQNW